jgi:hypothetical protein
VAALFVSIWHIYGETFSDWLPAVPGTPGRSGKAPPGGGALSPPGDEEEDRHETGGTDLARGSG